MSWRSSTPNSIKVPVTCGSLAHQQQQSQGSHGKGSASRHIMKLLRYVFEGDGKQRCSISGRGTSREILDGNDNIRQDEKEDIYFSRKFEITATVKDHTVDDGYHGTEHFEYLCQNSGSNSKLCASTTTSRLDSIDFNNGTLSRRTKRAHSKTKTTCSNNNNNNSTNQAFKHNSSKLKDSCSTNVKTSAETASCSAASATDWNLITIVVIFSIFCYINSLHGDFVHDDVVAVTSNPDVNGKNSIEKLVWNDFWGKPMSDPSSHKSYRPLTILTFRLNAVVWGLDNAVSFHITNVVLHSLVVVLLMQFCKEVFSWQRETTALAAFLFASHPIHTEAVCSIVGRADVLCCVLYITSLIACSRTSTFSQVVSLICASLALFAKETGVTVLGICILYQWLHLQERKLRIAKSDDVSSDSPKELTSARIKTRIAIIMITMALLLYVRGCLLHGTLPQFTEQDNPAAFSSSLSTRFLTYVYLPAFNLWLLLCPFNLSYDWQMGSIHLVETIWDPRNLVSLTYVATLVVLVAGNFQHKEGQSLERKRVLLSLSLLLFPFLPASNLFVTVGFVVAERVLYIPSLGFCLLVSHGLQKLMQRGPALSWLARTCAVVLIFFFVLKTMSRNTAWSSRESLFQSGLHSVPNNAKVHYNYANYRKDIGDKNSAVKHYRMALSLWPEHASSHNNLGTLLDDSEEAEHHFKEALRINPCHAKAHYNLASVYSKRGDYDTAKSFLIKAIRLDPEFVAALTALATMYSEVEGENEEAERLHRWAIKLEPDNADALNNYGTFLEKLGRTNEAMSMYEKAIGVQPNHTVAIVNAARSFKSLKHGRKAEEFYKRALEIKEDPQVLDNLGLLYYGSGRYREARHLYEDLTERYPHHNESKLHYAQLLMQERSYQQAETLLMSLKISSDRLSRDVLHLLASLYSFTNRTAEALESIIKALDLCSLSDSSCGRYYAEHGDILKDMEDYESAEESYKLALTLDPSLARAHLNLAVIYHIKGNYTSAKKHYQEAYNLDSSPTILLDNMKKLQRRIIAETSERCWWSDPSCGFQ